jgi:hypothetical protein
MKRAIFILGVLVTTMAIPSAQASICADADHCTFDFDIHNVGPTTFGTGPYGTLDLLLQGDGTIKVSIDLADGFGLIATGFPAGPGTNYSFAFNDNIGGTFSYGSYSNISYSGGTTAAGSYQFDGFQDFDRAAGATAVANTAGANTLSFVITRTGGFDSVQNLVGLSTGGGGTHVYFAADVFFNGDPNNPNAACGAGAGCTGLIGVTGNGTPPVPEPVTSGLVGTGLVSLFFLRRRWSR